MNATKVYWASNLRFLRTRAKLSQEAIAEQLQMSRSKYNAHENGQTINPMAEDLMRISDYFGISIDSMLRVDLGSLSEHVLKELESGNDSYMKGTRLRVLAITVDADNKEQMEYVPVKARAGYSAGYNDPEYIAALPRFSMPNLPATGSFRMFPTKGDSMLPIPEGSDIICRFLQDWSTLKPGTLCIVILKGQQDFVFKQVTLTGEGLLLQSLNKSYKPYTVPVSEVLELWQFHSFHSGTIPDGDMDMQEMAKMLRDIQSELKALKKEQA